MQAKRFIGKAMAFLLAVSLFIPYLGDKTEVFANPVIPKVAVGSNHSLLLKLDGSLWGWGDNSLGQLSDKLQQGTHNKPAKIRDGVQDIRAGLNLSFVQINGIWYSYGDGDPVPKVNNPDNTHNADSTSVTNGSHSIRIKNDGTVVTWGRNNFGQLGDGTLTDRTDEVQVAVISDVLTHNNFEYTMVGNIITIIRYLGNEANVVIPSSINNGTVTIITAGAFFNNSNLKEVTIPSTVTTIGEDAFANCANLAIVRLAHTNALSITTLGNNLNNNQNNAFRPAASNFTIIYPPGSNFTTPTWMSYPAIPDPGTAGNKEGNFEYSTAANGEITITKYTGNETAVTIPATINNNPVRRIGPNAFEQNNTMTTVTIPNGITHIGTRAFNLCTNLTRVVIPASVVEIQDFAFSSCSRLTNAQFLHTNGNHVAFGSDVFIGAASNFKITYPTNASGYNTPNWRGYPAEPHVFVSDFDYRQENNGVTIVRYRGTAAVPFIPSTVEEFPGLSVLRIDSAAFENNAHITSITIPNTVTAIGQQAFANCANLRTVTIPASVTSIGNNAFRDNPKLARAMFEHSNATTITTFGSNVFTGHASDFTIVYPRNATGFTQPSWQGYPSRPNAVAESDFQVTTSNNEATITRYNGSASTFDIPSHIGGNPVTKIGDNAFNGNTHLVSITIPGTVTAIGAQAFEYCSNLTHVAIPGSVVSIGFRAFGHCTSLTEVVIPASVITIENGAFADCNKLTNAKFEHPNANTITKFGEGVFNNAASGFTISHNDNAINFTTPTWKGYPVAQKAQTSGDWEFNIADGAVTIVKYVGTAAAVTIPPSIENTPVKIIGENAFNKTNITSVTFPASVSTIGKRAFSECGELVNVTIPATITNIADEAFSTCAKLAAAKFEHTDAALITSFGKDVFYGASTAFKIIYPANAAGFTTPNWNGYPAEPEAVVVETPPEEPPTPPSAAPVPTTASDVAVTLKRVVGNQSATNNSAITVNFRVMFNGAPRQLSNAILNADGTTYLPLRALGEELLGAVVNWDGINSIAILGYKGTVVETFAGSNQVVVDNLLKEISPGNPNARVFIRDGSMYVPIRAVSEAFGFQVNWDPATQTILLNE